MSLPVTHIRSNLLSVLRFMKCPAGVGLACCLVMLLGSSAFADDILTVTVDQARIVKVPSGTRTLIIGNPMIADVTLLKNDGTMIVTGKGFGDTNFIALDANGTPVAQSEISVVAGTNTLVVQRGMERQSYSCTPHCQPTARLGDDPTYFNQVTAQIQAHNAQATK
jgi:Flp pilus assembly secretin CpaC